MCDVLIGMQLQSLAFSLCRNAGFASFVKCIINNQYMCISAGQAFTEDIPFRKFRRQLFHASLVQILSTLKDGMTTPILTRCPDGHFRKIIYGLGPYIADYPEQILLTSVVQGWCAK